MLIECYIKTFTICTSSYTISNKVDRNKISTNTNSFIRSSNTRESDTQFCNNILNCTQITDILPIQSCSSRNKNLSGHSTLIQSIIKSTPYSNVASNIQIFCRISCSNTNIRYPVNIITRTSGPSRGNEWASIFIECSSKVDITINI